MQYVLSVTEINKYIKEIISRDLVLSNLWVRGEISNYKNHSSGHLYFTVKDEKSLLKCVMFRSQASVLKFVPKDGMKVIIRGYISIYERDGQYQLYAEEMQPDGMGSLHVAFEQLKQKLQGEGLFDAAVKKKLPYLPETIGVVTSSTGAVIKDIIHVLSRRFYNVHLMLYPVQVQGELAAGQIAHAVDRFNELDCVDVIILARGGGSLEDLWPFNEEIVARSIYRSRIPVVSAVGHETDFTIADFAADVRAPTPSAAAEIVIPDKASIRDRLSGLNSRMRNALSGKVGMERIRYDRLIESPAFRQPYNRIYQEKMRLDVQERYLKKAFEASQNKHRAKLAVLAGKLDALSPLGALARGYSLVRRKEDGRLISSIDQANTGDRVEISVVDGKIECKVEETVRGSL
jgi:exodeoxyribonuclease VII large subunit